MKGIVQELEIEMERLDSVIKMINGHPWQPYATGLMRIIPDVFNTL